MESADGHISSVSRYFHLFFPVFMCMLPMDPPVPVPPRGSQRALPAAVWSAPYHSTRKSCLPLRQGKSCPSQFPKCKSEDAVPWRRHGLGPEWALPAAHFSTKMFKNTRFSKGKSPITGRRFFTCFISYSAGSCAKVQAQSQGYCKLHDMNTRIHQKCKTT